MSKDVVKFGIGVAIGWMLVKVLTVIFVVATLPARLVFGMLK